MKFAIPCAIAILSYARAAPVPATSSVEPALAAHLASMLYNRGLGEKLVETKRDEPIEDEDPIDNKDDKAAEKDNDETDEPENVKEEEVPAEDKDDTADDDDTARTERALSEPAAIEPAMTVSKTTEADCKKRKRYLNTETGGCKPCQHQGLVWNIATEACSDPDDACKARGEYYFDAGTKLCVTKISKTAEQEECEKFKSTKLCVTKTSKTAEQEECEKFKSIWDAATGICDYTPYYIEYCKQTEMDYDPATGDCVEQKTAAVARENEEDNDAGLVDPGETDDNAIAPEKMTRADCADEVNGVALDADTGMCTSCKEQKRSYDTDSKSCISCEAQGGKIWNDERQRCDKPAAYCKYYNGVWDKDGKTCNYSALEKAFEDCKELKRSYDSDTKSCQPCENGWDDDNLGCFQKTSKTAEQEECERNEGVWDTEGNTCDYTEACRLSYGDQYTWDAGNGECFDFTCEVQGKVWNSIYGCITTGEVNQLNTARIVCLAENRYWNEAEGTCAEDSEACLLQGLGSDYTWDAGNKECVMKTAEHRECEDKYQGDWDPKGNTCDYTKYYAAYCKSLGTQYIWDAGVENCVDSCEANGGVWDAEREFPGCVDAAAYCKQSEGVWDADNNTCSTATLESAALSTKDSEMSEMEECTIDGDGIWDEARNVCDYTIYCQNEYGEMSTYDFDSVACT